MILTPLPDGIQVSGKKKDTIAVKKNNALPIVLSLAKYENKYNVRKCLKKCVNFGVDLFNHFARLENREKQQPTYNIKNSKPFFAKKFLELLHDFLCICGIPNIYLKNEDDFFILGTDDIIGILNYCVRFKELHDKQISNEDTDIEFTIKYKYTQKKNEKAKVFNITNTLDDVLKFDMLTKKTKTQLKPCAYCEAYFLGNSRQKCCSSRCRDLKNGKYEKRKLKKQQEQKGQEKTENDTNNQQK